MQNKKRLQKHLLTIYIIYFVALVISFAASFVPEFSRGWRDADQTIALDMANGNQRTYHVCAPIQQTERANFAIEGLPTTVTPSINELNMQVSVSEPYTFSNAFRVIANNGWAYVLTMIMGLSYLAILVLIALIINSIRKSIRDEQPLRHSNIMRTRAIAILLIATEVSDALTKYIQNIEATRLLEGTSFEVVSLFPMNYWNIIVAILFFFMAEVFSIGTQLSEEQKLTI
ncbi:MAG: DUF2975 domain-containing protein [Alistipes sp.]